MRILADLHHFDKFYSLQLLFEKRLGWELYRPIGLDWSVEDFWYLSDYPEINLGMLSTETDICKTVSSNYLNQPWMRNAIESQKIGEVIDNGDGIYQIKDTSKNIYQKGITLEKFKNTEFDIIVSSLPQHIQRFNKLIQLYQPKAKHIFQMGNNWGSLPDIKNLLTPVKNINSYLGANICHYHQEFDLNVFSYSKDIRNKKISSYIHDMQRLDILNIYKNLLSDFSFETCGLNMDKILHETKEVAHQMKNSLFTWHYKPEGDGYGYSCFQTCACGTPLIVNKSFYQNQAAEILMEDQITCIDISKRNILENAKIIRKFSEPEEYAKLSQQTYNRFKEYVNFDEEFIKVKSFLENLQ